MRALVLPLLLAGCASTHQIQGAASMPPERYQQSRPVMVEIVSPEMVASRCIQRGAVVPAMACANTEFITMPNPCQYQDWYARLLCHELGHVNGWPAHHPEE